MTRKLITLDGNTLNLKKGYSISRGARVAISNRAKVRIQKSRELVEKKIKEGNPIYGVNTGFGFLANTQIGKKELKNLQVNILRSHASGAGPYLSEAECRLALALRLNVFLKGRTGVRMRLCNQILRLLNSGVTPAIPELGSVGASGDLIPLAHLALPLIGEGKVYFNGKVVAAAAALRKKSVSPIELHPKEGLSLVNGTQVMLAVGVPALFEALQLIEQADQIAALSLEGFDGIPAALDPRVHEVRGHRGQMESAERMRSALSGSSLLKADPLHGRVQDPYSLRCAPQIHGPSRDALRYVKQVVERELNACTDNPLVFLRDNKIVSSGNFHGQCLAMAYDFATIACSEMSNVSERRLELLLNPHFSDLPSFLSPQPGVNSGYMALQYQAASSVNRNKILATPASTDSIPGNVGVEDHVSMGMTAALKFREVVENLRRVLAAELLAAAQAVDLRGKKRLGRGTSRLYQQLRDRVPQLKDDRIIAEDLARAVEVLEPAS